jgi:flagellar L-ring protein precursor FlgH
MQPDNEALTVEEYLEAIRAERENRPAVAAATAAAVVAAVVAPATVETRVEEVPAVEAFEAFAPVVATETAVVATTTPAAASPEDPAASEPDSATAASGAERVIVRRVDRAKPKRSRRRGRTSLAARVIMGMSLLLAVTQPAGSVSLWGNGSGSIFTQPVRTFKSGDIITIIVNEATTADQQWKWEREKEWQVGATASDPGAGAGKKNLFARFFPFMGLDFNSEYTTDNRSDRSTNFRATVSAEVVNVMPNGNLQIVARKVIRVNSEEQLIELTGNIRPLDVTLGNTISSNAIADANIKVNGTLRYTNDANPSPLERVFSFISGLFL